MAIPFWAGKYIGLPFREHGRDRNGVDCWGLVRIVLEEEFGIILPCYATHYRDTKQAGKISQIVGEEKQWWASVPPGQEQPGDVVLIRMRGQPTHVGVVIGDNAMLHVAQGIDSAIENYTRISWKDRVTGFYRYAIRPN